jgi:hypothetical protein
MIYTKEKKLILSAYELAEIFGVSHNFIITKLDSYRLNKYIEKRRPIRVNFSDDFIKDFRDYIALRQNNTAKKILNVIDSITP